MNWFPIVYSIKLSDKPSFFFKYTNIKLNILNIVYANTAKLIFNLLLFSKILSIATLSSCKYS